MISLTGSSGTGKWIAREAAESLKRVHLELGGKAPVVIFDDADMEAAMETIAGTGYYNAGQDCTAATRVLASRRVYDDVVSGLSSQAESLVMGDTLSADTALGPVNSLLQRERVEGFLERRPGYVDEPARFVAAVQAARAEPAAAAAAAAEPLGVRAWFVPADLMEALA